MIEQGREQFIANSIVHCEVLAHPPSVLRKKVVRDLVIVNNCGRCKRCGTYIAEQEVRHAEAAVGRVNTAGGNLTLR